MPILPATEAAIAEAAALLRSGGLVGMPTETVYGLAAAAANPDAIAAIYRRKSRPRFNPLIAHVTDLSAAEQIGRFDLRARTLARLFWPGPLSIVVERRGDGVHDLAAAGLPTIAVRAPRHQVTQALLRAFGGPVVAPSANPSGRLSPTSAADVAAAFPDLPVLDGGPCPVGVESTIVDLSGDQPVLLRPGGVPRAALEAAIGPLAMAGEAVKAPGMLASHYAPALPLRLGASGGPEGHEALLAFGPSDPAGYVAVRNLSPQGDLNEAAANLFAHLRALDASGADRIAVMPVPNGGLGEAINDRLARAAAPR